MIAKEYLSIARLVWPLALGMLNNAVLQFADRAFLARESMASTEAALPSSMLAYLVSVFFMSVVAYSGTFVAQYHGAGNARGEAVSYRAGSLIAVASGLLAIATIPAGLLLMPLVSANPQVVSRAGSYFTIVSLGAVALCGQMSASSYFTARGKTRLVFSVNLLGNLLNVALDPVLIFGKLGAPRMGIAGAAWATVIAMSVQWAILAAIAERDLRRARRVVPSGAESADDCAFWPVVRRILAFGIPSGAYSVLNVLSFTLFVFATGRVGDVEFAASNACFSVNYLLIAPMEGFALGASTLVSQCQGRGDTAGARAALRRVLAMGLALVAILSLAAVAFHRQILSLFAPQDPALVEPFMSLGFKLVLLMAAWQIFDAADVIVSGALKGAGDTRFVMWWMVAAAFGFWLPLVAAVRLFHNTMPALWTTMVAYVFVICCGEAIRWRRGRWEKIKLL